MAALGKQAFYFKQFVLRNIANSFILHASRNHLKYDTNVVKRCHHRLILNNSMRNFYCLCDYKNSSLRIGHRSFSLGSSLKKDDIPHPADYELDSHSLSRALMAQKNPQKVLYNDIIDEFPEGLQMVFTYGSGAFQQQNSKDKSQNMLDFIFVVDKPEQWHRMNLEKHPHHYSLLKRFGSHFITQIQENHGAGVYFNTLVSMNGRIIKYGVISTARLTTDLLDWETLYVSGRLHKPVSLIILPTDEELVKGLKENIESAVHTALLLLPDLFTEKKLYMTIAGLSYAGDIRMAMAEDKNKIRNIVEPNMSLFRKMYAPVLTQMPHVAFWPAEGQLEQALTFTSRHYHLTHLPCQVLYGLLMQKYQVGVFPDLEEIIHLHAHDSECANHINYSVKQIVRRSSTSQSLKGFLTAGLFKSMRYSISKVMKNVKSQVKGSTSR